MKFLNAQQLAFILDIKKEDARAKMCNAWEKEKGISKDNDHSVHGAAWNAKGKVEDSYPHAMPIEILENHLNLPHLQKSVDDIHQNYLTRSASKKYILFDYPEKKLNEAVRGGKKWPISIDLPPALKSMLPTETIQEIYKNWKCNFTFQKDGETVSKFKVKISDNG